MGSLAERVPGAAFRVHSSKFESPLTLPLSPQGRGNGEGNSELGNPTNSSLNNLNARRGVPNYARYTSRNLFLVDGSAECIYKCNGCAQPTFRLPFFRRRSRWNFTHSSRRQVRAPPHAPCVARLRLPPTGVARAEERLHRHGTEPGIKEAHDQSHDNPHC